MRVGAVTGKRPKSHRSPLNDFCIGVQSRDSEFFGGIITIVPTGKNKDSANTPPSS